MSVCHIFGKATRQDRKSSNIVFLLFTFEKCTPMWVILKLWCTFQLLQSRNCFSFVENCNRMESLKATSQCNPEFSYNRSFPINVMLPLGIPGLTRPVYLNILPNKNIYSLVN